MTGLRRGARIAGTTAVALGVAALLYVGLVVAQARPSDLALLPDPPASAPSEGPASRPLVAGESLGQIHIPRLGLRADIREGEAESVLQRGVGHLADTPWMGQDGNVALAGHRDTVFRPLEGIQPGDVIEIATGGGTITYSVEQVTIVPPDDLSVLAPSGGSTLTLITCHPFKFIGSAPNRFIVRAKQITPLPGSLPATRRQ